LHFPSVPSQTGVVLRAYPLTTEQTSQARPLNKVGDLFIHSLPTNFYSYALKVTWISNNFRVMIRLGHRKRMTEP
jgi:hypothetical protein